MADRKTPKISIGITSMTVILCVLCLTVFSVLTLSTALSERNFAQKRAQATQEYYTAESEAVKLVNELQEAMDDEGKLQTMIQKNEIVTDGNRLRFEKTIDDGQALKVVLRMEDNLRIEAWQVVSTADWTPDNSLNIWGGDLMMEE